MQDHNSPPEVAVIRGMLDLFSAADGGLALMKLRGIISGLQQAKPDDGVALEILRTIKAVNRLCQSILDGKFG
jgi:hypothetical protein